MKEIKKMVNEFVDSVICKAIFNKTRMKYVVPFSLPKFVKIETTNFCNAKCKYCQHKSMSRKKGFISDKLFKKIVCDIADLNIPEVHLTNFGESLLDPKIFGRIRYVKNKAPFTKVVIITNGFLLNKRNISKIISSGIDEIQVSFDGFSKKHYEKYRTPFKFWEIKENINNLIERKKESSSPMSIRLNVICGSDVSKRMVKCFKESWEHKVDMISFQRLHNWSAINGRNSNAPCWDTHQYMTITWTGDVLPCCIDYDGKIVLGNLGNETIKDVWFGKKFNAFRKSLLNSRKNTPICKTCSTCYEYPYLNFLRFVKR